MGLMTEKEPVNQNRCFIISDILLTFQWSYDFISLWNLRQLCFPFAKALIYTLPNITGPWSTTETLRCCSNTATWQRCFLFTHFLFSPCLRFMHKCTWIYIAQVYTYFQRINTTPPPHKREGNTPMSSPNVALSPYLLKHACHESTY